VVFDCVSDKGSFIMEDWSSSMGMTMSLDGIGRRRGEESEEEIESEVVCESAIDET
jgi:hypothetical protein